MKSPWNSMNSPRHSAEAALIKKEKGEQNFDNLVEKSRPQARAAIDHANFITILIGGNHAAQLLSIKDEKARINRAKSIARSNERYMPDTMDEEEGAAYIVALCMELNNASPQGTH